MSLCNIEIDPDLLAFCKALPKVELHAHLNGSVRPTTLKQLALEKGLQADADAVFESARTLSECFQVFDLIHQITTEANTIRRIARECCEDFASEGCAYLELRTTPKHRLGRECMTKRDYVEAVLDGIQDFYDTYTHIPTRHDERNDKGPSSHGPAVEDPNGICRSRAGGVNALEGSGRDAHASPQESGRALSYHGFHVDGADLEPHGVMIVRVLLSIDRREDAASASETVALAKEYASVPCLRPRGIVSSDMNYRAKRNRVVGVDLGGNPTIGRWDEWLSALNDARTSGLKVSLHCAEVVNDEESAAMLAWHPDRLGHCCFLNEASKRELRKKEIPVEICLTSNTFTVSMKDWNDHHFAELYDAGHPIALSTDDPGVFSTTLSREYAIAAAAFNLSRDEIGRLAMDAVGMMFMGCDDEKDVGDGGRISLDCCPKEWIINRIKGFLAHQKNQNAFNHPETRSIGVKM